MPEALRNALFVIASLTAAAAVAQPLQPDIIVTRTINAPAGGDRTTLTLRNFGYGEGEEWAKAKAYFEKAWPVVMASLEKRFANR